MESLPCPLGGRLRPGLGSGLVRACLPGGPFQSIPLGPLSQLGFRVLHASPSPQALEK